MHKIFTVFIVVIFVLHLIIRIWSYLPEYTTPYDADYWEQRYFSSQWVVPNSKNAIGDDGLYAYSGWKYITGADPTLLNAELPPFGKYLIGISILLFRNQNIFALLSGLLVLSGFYLLNSLAWKEKLYALLPVVFFSFEPLFYTQLRAPFLDLLYVGLFLYSCFSFLKRQYLFSMVFLGLMMATKASSATFFLVVFVQLLFLFLQKHRELLRQYVLMLPVAMIIFMATYLQFFLRGNSLIDFLRVQKYILAFYAEGAKGSILAVWEMVLTGQYRTWFGSVQYVQEWHPVWIILLVGLGITLVLLIKKRLFSSLFFLFASWAVVYLLFLQFVPVFPRYLLVVLPFLYNLIIWLLPQLRNIRVK